MNLTEAQEEHQRLRTVIGEQYRHADPAPVEAFALLAVHDLLGEHRPVDCDWPHPSSVMCAECDDAWPCVVYQVIEKASHRGE